MKKINISILIIFFSYQILAQNKDLVAEYDIFYNTDYPVVRKGKLVIKNNPQESIFLIESSIGQRYNKAELKGKSRIEYTIGSGKNILLFNYFKVSNQELLSKEQILNDTYVIKEEIPKIDWVLEEEEKQIGKNLLKKATTVFRGRKFIAWYCLDYPVQFGPWKFNGLPGLIFEIYDETERYHWRLKNISNDYKYLEVFNLINNSKKSDTITIKEYSDLRYNQNFSATRILSKMPRDVKISSFKTTKHARNGIEILFEWEEETKKD